MSNTLATERDTPGPAAPESRRPGAGYARTSPTGFNIHALPAKIRKTLNDNSAGVGVAALVALVFSLGYIAYFPFSRSGGELKKFAWYYDTNTGQLFAADYDPRNLGFIEAASGKAPDGQPAGARAFVYSCGACDAETDRFVGFLAKPGSAGTWSMETALYTLPRGSKWVGRDSPEADILFESLKAKCGTGEMPAECWPEHK